MCRAVVSAMRLSANLYAHAAENGMSLFDVVSNAAQVEGLSIRFVSKLDELAAIIFDLMNQADNLPVEELIEQVLNKTGYMEELRNEHTAQAQSRIDNLMELMSVGQEFAKTAEENNLEDLLAMWRWCLISTTPSWVRTLLR